jgi:phosphatidylinositol alpha-1,6-mannosyltransferase
VLLEAQAMAKPVVAYSAGGTIRAIQQGVTGFLVPEMSPSALCAALRELLGDAEKRIAMGVRGRQWIIDTFSVDALASRHEAWYHHILHPHA